MLNGKIEIYRTILQINDIIDLGSYDNLRKILERMTKSGTLRRLIRGVYEIPKYNKTFNMFAPPSIDYIAKGKDLFKEEVKTDGKK